MILPPASVMSSIAGYTAVSSRTGAVAVSAAMVITTVAMTVMNVAASLRTACFRTNRIISPAIMAVMDMMPRSAASLLRAYRIASPVSAAVMDMIPCLSASVQRTRRSGSLRDGNGCLSAAAMAMGHSRKCHKRRQYHTCRHGRHNPFPPHNYNSSCINNSLFKVFPQLYFYYTAGSIKCNTFFLKIPSVSESRAPCRRTKASYCTDNTSHTHIPAETPRCKTRC